MEASAVKRMLVMLLVIALASVGSVTAMYSGECNKDEFPTSGCEFFFNIAYLHRTTTPARVIITTSSNNPVSVSLTVPGFGLEFNYTITRYKHVEISLSSEIRLNPGDGIQDKTIVVRSSEIVSVYAMDNEISKGEGFLVLPKSQLGTEYYVLSYQHTAPGDPSFFCGSAFIENTVVNIRTKSGQQEAYILQPYQSFRFDGIENEDLTGTFVKSDKPIALISGGKTKIPENIDNIDGLLEQLPPYDKWGRNYVMSSYLGINSGFIYRILSGPNATNVSISNIGTFEIPANNFYEANITEEVLISIESDNPVLVMQYNKGALADPENPRRGDPSMMLVQSLETYANSVSFGIMDTTFGFDYYINVIIDCRFVVGLLYDDVIAIGSAWSILRSVDNSTCSVRGTTTEGAHTVIHTDPSRRFAVSVYAISRSCCTAYSYIAGAGFPYVPEFTSTTSFAGITTEYLDYIHMNSTDAGLLKTVEATTEFNPVSIKTEPTTPTVITINEDDVRVLRLVIVVCVLSFIIIVLIGIIVALVKSIRSIHAKHHEYKGNLPNEVMTSDSGVVPVELSGDGYVRYNADGTQSELSYQGLHATPTLASSNRGSNNNAYEVAT